jgi:hypothetical protein
MPFVAALVLIVVMVFAVSVFELEPSMILFSGQGESMSTLIGESSVGLVIAIIALKAIGYALSRRWVAR